MWNEVKGGLSDRLGVSYDSFQEVSGSPFADDRSRSSLEPASPLLLLPSILNAGSKV